MGFVLFQVLLNISTVVPSEVQPIFDALHLDVTEHFATAQAVSASFVLFAFLWGFFFFEAVLNCTTSHAVAHWYFQDDGYGHHAGLSVAGVLGIPVVYSCVRVCRFHLGSLAMGSLLMTLVTVPCVVLEYVERRANNAPDNTVAKAILRA